MPHYSTTEYRARTDYMETGDSRDARAIREPVPEALGYLNLRRGDFVTFETLHVEAETVMEREFRYGFTGQQVERPVKRTERITNSETLKLWKTKARGWYWKA